MICNRCHYLICYICACQSKQDLELNGNQRSIEDIESEKKENDNVGEEEKEDSKTLYHYKETTPGTIASLFEYRHFKQGTFYGGKSEKEYAANRSFKKVLREKIEKQNNIANETEEVYSDGELNMLFEIYGTDDNLRI